MSKTWYVVMALQPWEFQSSPASPPHWLAVFADRKKAEAWADGKTVVEVRIDE